MNYKVVTSLWPHQEAAVAAVGNKNTLLWAGMRTGKTLIALKLAEYYERVLVVAPKQVAINVWPYEINKHTIYADYELLSHKTEHLTKHITIANYELIWRPQHAHLLAEADLVILDESHRIKASGSKVSKYFAKQYPKQLRLAMTGTPMPHSPMDIFGQARFLGVNWNLPINQKPYNLLRSFTRFRMQYEDLWPIGTGIYKTIGRRNEQDFNERLQNFVYRIDSRDVIRMPKEVIEPRYVTQSPYTRTAYKNFARDMVVELENGTLSADNALVKSLRLRQLAGGFASLDNDVHLVDRNKLDMLEELLDEIGDEPVVIFANFRAEIDAIRGMGVLYELSGIHNHLDLWQKHGGAIVIQERSGSEGLDLTKARFVVYYSVDHSLGMYEQSKARVSGQLQTSDEVVIYQLISKGTIDEVIYKAFETKTDVLNSILEHIKKAGNE